MIKRIKLFFLCCVVLLIGVSAYKDYGFGSDELINRTNGEISYNYVYKIITNTKNKNEIELREVREKLDNYKDRDYGVVFDLPVMAIEKILKLENSQSQYMLRHGLTHLIFLIALIYFYKIIFNRFKSEKLGLMAVGFIYINPRIFAESFYNNKDIIFMSLFIIALYYSIELIKKQNLKNCILAGLTTALAIDARIIGVMLPGIILTAWILEKIKNYKIVNNKFIIYGLLYLTVVIFFTVAMWPWLWTAPIDNFIEAFKNMAKFRWLNWVLYRGHYYLSTDLPWHYLPVWISITTPVAYLALFLFGNFVLIKRTILYKFHLYNGQNELIDLAIAAIFIVPIFAVVILKSTIYDGWRQFYFLYPSLVYVSIIGLNELLKSRIKFFVIAVLIFEIINTTYWMIKNHPYQYVYFNKLSGENVDKNYEMDYWGVTNVDALKKILREEGKDNIKVYGLGNTSIPQAFLLLSNEDAKRLSKTNDINDADYVVTNHRMLGQSQTEARVKMMQENFIIFFEIKVDNKIIGSIFKKINN